MIISCSSRLLSGVIHTALAKSMLVLMVHGLFSKIAFLYAQFACASMTGDLLMDPVWEAISRLEQQGIRVLAQIIVSPAPILCTSTIQISFLKCSSIIGSII